MFALLLHDLKYTINLFLISADATVQQSCYLNDLETVCSDLEKKKVKFHKKMTNEVFGKHAIIEDPDGHLISLAEMVPKEEFKQIPYYHGFAPE